MKILIFGSSGLLGDAFNRVLKDHHEVHTKTHAEVDVSNSSYVCDVINNIRPDVVLNCAAVVGGLYSQINHPANYLTNNVSITDGLYNGLMLSQHKCITYNFLSTCVYPKTASYPLTPDQIEDGPPHGSNKSYSLAKRLQLTYADAFWSEYQISSCNITLGNLFGLGDHFSDPLNAHVIPALFIKFLSALKNGDSSVELLGNGEPLREFLFADDAALIISSALLSDRQTSILKDAPPSHFLLSNHSEISIKDLAFIVRQTCKACDVDILWGQVSDPGQLRKPSISSDVFQPFLSQFRPIEHALAEIYSHLIRVGY